MIGKSTLRGAFLFGVHEGRCGGRKGPLMRTVGDAGPYGGSTGAGVPERRGEAPRAERCGVPRGEFATLPHKNPVFAWPPSDCIDFRQMNCLKIGAGLPARPRRAVFALFYVPSESGRGHSGETRFPPERSHGRSPYRSAERFAIFGVRAQRRRILSAHTADSA